MADINVPKESIYYKRKQNNPKKKAERAINDFKNLMNDKTHPDNQTEGYRNNVISVLNNLFVAADELDNINPGEGIFSLIALALRSSLKMRDKNIELEVKLRKLELEIKRLNKS